jgi:hypothetical protein
MALVSAEVVRRDSVARRSLPRIMGLAPLDNVSTTPCAVLLWCGQMAGPWRGLVHDCSQAFDRSHLSPFNWLPAGSVKRFIITALCLSATLAGNGLAKGKRHIETTKDKPVYQATIMRFPNGNGFLFSIGPFPIILPSLVIEYETLMGPQSHANHPDAG